MLIYCIQFYWTSTLLGVVISQFIYILVLTLNFFCKNKKANKQTNRKFNANQLPLTLRKLYFLKNMGSRFYSLREGLVSYFYTLMLGPVSPVLGSRGLRSPGPTFTPCSHIKRDQPFSLSDGHFWWRRDDVMFFNVNHHHLIYFMQHPSVKF